MLYQPLTAGKFLLKMDNSLWLVELANQQMGTYLWSIYSLVPNPQWAWRSGNTRSHAELPLSLFPV